MFLIRTTVAKKRSHVRPHNSALMMANAMLNQVTIRKIFGARDEFVHH